MPRYQAVFFDFAGTLFSDRALRDVHLRTLESVAADAEMEATTAELRAAYRHGMATAHLSFGDKSFYMHRDLFRETFRQYIAALGGDATDTVCDRGVDTMLAATIANFRLRDDCIATVDRLQADGSHVQVVSNIDDEQLEPMLARSGLADKLDAWTSSEAAAFCKPEPRIFEIALGKAAAKPTECLFVGDTPHHDIETPKTLGMSTALLVADRNIGQLPENLEPDQRIERLSDIL